MTRSKVDSSVTRDAAVYSEMVKSWMSCPICSGSAFEVLTRIDRYRMGVQTCACERCGLVMTNPMPSAAALDDFYRNEYRRYYRKVSHPSIDLIRRYKLDERAQYTAAYLAAEGLLRGSARVLDVGCAEGSLLKAVGKIAPDAIRTGIEPNPGYAAFARDWAGAEVFSDLAAVESRAGAFDVIVANHVLEHMREPVDFLTRLRRLLQGSGVLYLDVPDATRYASVASLHVAHLYHFTPAALDRLAVIAGFAVVNGMAHQPPAHPPSIRVLLAPATPRGLEWTPDEHAKVVRNRIRRLARRAPLYFFKRSLIGSPLVASAANMMRALRSRAPRGDGMTRSGTDV